MHVLNGDEDHIISTAMQSGCNLHHISHLSSTDPSRIESRAEHFSDGSPKQLIYDVCMISDARQISLTDEPTMRLACCSFYDSILYTLDPQFIT